MNILTPFREYWGITVSVLAGMAAIYLLLPRPKPFPRLLGAGFAALALILAGALLIHTNTAWPETVLFYTFSAIAIIAGGLLVTQRNPAYAALSFALVVLSTCGLFLLQAAPFLMAATAIIYAGAIIVTFLFVLMLAQTEGPTGANDRSREPAWSVVGGFVLLGALLYVLTVSTDLSPEVNAFLEQARRAGKEDTPEKIDGMLGGENFFEQFHQVLRKSASLRSLDYAVENLALEWPENKRGGAAAMKKALARLDEEAARLRLGYAATPPGPRVPLSEFSGLAPNRPIRRDAAGNGVMPAENVAYLGRSLFTDYLLAVELAGTLLLVATIGAIAVASRAGERAA